MMPRAAEDMWGFYPFRKRISPSYLFVIFLIQRNYGNISWQIQAPRVNGLRHDHYLVEFAQYRLLPVDVMIVAWVFSMAVSIQILAGMMEFKKGNTFGLTAFTSYGAFWLSLVGILMLPRWALLMQQCKVSSARILACGAFSPYSCFSAP